MSAIIPILIGIAAEIGAPIVKGMLQKHVGGAAGEVGSVIVDAIAGKVGVPVDELPQVPREQLESAVREIEQDPVAVIAAYTDRLRVSHDLMKAEMGKDSQFGWLWRPAGMWLMLGCVAWYVMLVPLINALLSAVGAHTTLVLIVDFASFVTIFMTYCGLYMGGNTVLRSVKK